MLSDVQCRKGWKNNYCRGSHNAQLRHSMSLTESDSVVTNRRKDELQISIKISLYVIWSRSHTKPINDWWPTKHLWMAPGNPCPFWLLGDWAPQRLRCVWRSVPTVVSADWTVDNWCRATWRATSVSTTLLHSDFSDAECPSNWGSSGLT